MTPTLVQPTTVPTQPRQSLSIHRFVASVSPAGLFVALAWFGMTALALAFTIRFALPVPFWDEWGALPFTPDGPIDLWSWLIAAHNEHRYPLPRLIFWVLGQLSGCDLRAACIASVVGMSVFSLACVRTAKSIRGQVSYADAFFPLIVLSLGQFENFLMGYQVCFTLTTILAGSILLVAVRSIESLLNWTSIAIVSGSLVMLPMCGMAGVLWTPAFSPWVALVGWKALQSETTSSRLRGLLACVSVVVALAIAGICVMVRVPTPNHPASPGVMSSLWVAGDFLAMSFGRVGAIVYPVSVWAAFAATAVLALALAVLLLRPSAERFRLIGLSACYVGVVVMALAIGWGRSGFGELAGLASRYATLAMPLLLVAYFTASLYGGRLMGSFLPMVLFTMSCGLLVMNTRSGWADGRLQNERVAGVLHDAQAGLPISVIAERAAGLANPDPYVIRAGLLSLQKANVAWTKNITADPNVRRVPIPFSTCDRISWDGKIALGRGCDSAFVFELKSPLAIEGVRLKLAMTDGIQRLLRLKLHWTVEGQSTEQEQSVCIDVGPNDSDEKSALFWNVGTVKRFRVTIDDKPWSAKIIGFELLQK